MNFQSLHYFIMLAREKNFTRAAEKLHISQQTLSASIAALERELNCKLIIRHVPLELTYGGRTFFHYALSLSGEEESMRRSLLDIAEEKTGELRIGVGYVRGRTLLPPILKKFGDKHPGVTFRILESTNKQLRTRLVEGDIDLSIGHYREVPPGIEIEPIYEEQICLLITKKLFDETVEGTIEEVSAALQRDGKEGMRPFAKCPFLNTRGENVSGYFETLYLAEAPFTPFIRCMSNNMETLLCLSGKGMGALFCPQNLVRSSLSKEDLREMYVIPLPETKYAMSVGVRTKAAPWSIRDEFIQLLKEELARKNGI